MKQKKVVMRTPKTTHTRIFVDDLSLLDNRFKKKGITNRAIMLRILIRGKL